MLIARVVHDVSAHFIVRMGEWVFGVMMFLIGIQMMRDGHLFATGPGWMVMRGIATEFHWGLALAAVGGARIAALIANGSFVSFRRYSPLVRAICAFLCAMVWAILSLGVFLANSNGILFIVTTGICVRDIGLSYAIAGEAGGAYMRYSHGPRQ